MAIVVTIICAAACLMLYWQCLKRRAVLANVDIMGECNGRSIPKLEQIRVLEELGICFTSEADRQNFIMGCSYEMNDYLAYHPYSGLLISAGSMGILEHVYSAGNREHMNTPDAWGNVMEGLKRISGMDFENITSSGSPKIFFTLNGNEYQWEGTGKGQRADMELAGFLNQILDKEGGTCSRFYLDNSHQAPIYIWGAKDKIRAVNIETNLKFHQA